MFPGVGAAAGLYWGTEEVTSEGLTGIQAKWTLELKLSKWTLELKLSYLSLGRIFDIYKAD